MLYLQNWNIRKKSKYSSKYFLKNKTKNSLWFICYTWLSVVITAAAAKPPCHLTLQQTVLLLSSLFRKSSAICTCWDQVSSVTKSRDTSKTSTPQRTLSRTITNSWPSAAALEIRVCRWRSVNNTFNMKAASRFKEDTTCPSTDPHLIWTPFRSLEATK